MKPDRQIALSAFLAVSLMTLLTGCAMLPKERIVGNAIDYNLAVEKAHNEILLLNIVRASKRRPLYFTSFSSVKANMTNTFTTGSFSIPLNNLGGGLDTAYVLTPSATHAFNPFYEFSVLDSQEFMRGITTPLTVELVDYYLRQGWPPELILHLVVKRVEGVKGKGGRTYYDNYPDDKEKWDEFHEFIKTCKLESEDRPLRIGTTMDKLSSTNLKELVEIHKAGLTLEKVGEPVGGTQEYRIVPKKKYFFKCGEEQFSIAMRDGDGAGLPAKKQVSLRSPEAILYYLGELARASMEKPFKYKIAICKEPEDLGDIASLFVVQKSAGADEEAVVAVEYDGEKYVVRESKVADSCDMDRSMDVLSFLSQIIALQKSAKEMPVTGVVEVIGR